MKIKITLKDPDGVSDSLMDAEKTSGVPVEELEDMIQSYVEYAEYVTIEIDTDTNTARVLGVREV